MRKLLIAGSVALTAILTCSLTMQSPQAATKAKTVKIKSVTAKKNTKVTVKYKRQKKASGYQIKFSTSKSFKKSKTITKTVGKKKTSCTTKRFSAGDTVYVKVRFYKIVNGKKHYGKWSTVKKVIIPTNATDSDNDTTKTTSDISYSLDGTTLTISGSGTISSISGYETVEYIYIEDGITGIGSTVFYNLSTLKYVEIADSVTYIGGFAFGHCNNLEEIVLPTGITEIAEYTFSGCKSLKEITIPENVKSISWCAFLNCTGLTSVTVPVGLEKIAESAFAGCVNLTNINIPDGCSLSEDDFVTDSVAVPD